MTETFSHADELGRNKNLILWFGSSLKLGNAVNLIIRHGKMIFLAHIFIPPYTIEYQLLLLIYAAKIIFMVKIYFLQAATRT